MPYVEVLPLRNASTNALSQFAFHGIDVHEALKEISGAEALPLRTKVSVCSVGNDEICLRVKALRAVEMAQLFQVGRMIQEVVRIS